MSRIRTCLLVDDDPEYRQLLTLAFEALGYPVHQAAHGAEALSVLHARPVDLVVTDLEMPVMDGWNLVRRLRARDYAGRIVVLSSLPRSEPLWELVTGADLTLTKDRPILSLAADILAGG